jgi:hypothetical protein
VAKPAPITQIGVVELTDDQLQAIEEANGWSVNALAELGAAYLEFAQVEARYLKAKTHLTTCKGSALEAEMKRGNVVAAIASGMNLPPGEWSYDASKKALVRKESPHD